MNKIKRSLFVAVSVTAVALGTVVAAQPASAATSCVQQTFGPNYASNTTRCVKDIQKMLNSWGAYNRITVDGAYGAKTAETVRFFQNNTAYSGTADGIVGPKTWAQLCKVNNASAKKDAGC